MSIVVSPGRTKATCSGLESIHWEGSDEPLLVTGRVLKMGRACMTIGQRARLEPLPTGPLSSTPTIRIDRVTGTSFKRARISPFLLEAFQ